jgi:1-acyl-sn-glycerol-3-phosphate acyltransferase
MVGTAVAQPIGRKIPKIMRIGMVIGEPLDFSRYAGMENDRFILRSVTDEIMYAIMSLSGQEYVDVYAATQKARIATGHPAAAGDVADHLPAAPGGRPVPEVQVPVAPPEQDEPSVG